MRSIKQPLAQLLIILTVYKSKMQTSKSHISYRAPFVLK